MAESLSALLDGEASEMELHRTLRGVEADPALRQTWQRYQYISASMRNQVADGPVVDLSAAIRDALDDEERLGSPRSGWRTHLGRVAVAASVAAVMVFTTQMVGVPGENASAPATATLADNTASTAGAASVSSAPVSLPAGFQAPSVSARAVSSGQTSRMSAPASAQRYYYPVVTKAQQSASPATAPSPEVQSYLQRVMEVHAGNAALNSGRGLMPYARVPAVSAEQP